MNATGKNVGRWLLVGLVLLGATGGCAGDRMRASWAAPLTELEAQDLATEVVAVLAQREPPARTVLVLEPDARSRAFAAELEKALRKAGYALALPGSKLGDAHRLRYLVSELDGGVLLRLTLDQLELSRWYARDGRGRLRGASPLTVREAGLTAEAREP